MVVTDDERGVAQSVAEALQEQGQAAALVRMGEYTEMLAPGQYRADLTTPATVRELLDLIRQQQGPVGGLIHLLPLRMATVSKPSTTPTHTTAARRKSRVYSI